LRRDFLIRVWQAGVAISTVCTGSRPLLAADNVDVVKGAPMQKIALLVCCGSYPGGNSILPARKNGRDLEAALRRHGFDVKVENDLDLRRFSAAIEHFGPAHGAAPKRRPQHRFDLLLWPRNAD
jgi:hypothetical protein